MFVGILKRMREKIRTRQYVMTLHAEEEMSDEGFTVYDVEGGILTGHIVERQKDRETDEWKYVLHGRSIVGKHIAIVAKMSVTGKLVIITVYEP